MAPTKTRPMLISYNIIVKYIFARIEVKFHTVVIEKKKKKDNILTAVGLASSIIYIPSYNTRYIVCGKSLIYIIFLLLFIFLFIRI